MTPVRVMTQTLRTTDLGSYITTSVLSGIFLKNEILDLYEL